MALDPKPDIDKAAVVVATADQLDADRQTVWPLPRRQRQARHVEHGPENVKDRRSGAAEPARRLARCRQRQDRVKLAGPGIGRRARPLGLSPGGAEILESEPPPRGDPLLAQFVAQQRLVAVKLGGMVARRLI